MVIRPIEETDLDAVERIILRNWDEVLPDYHSAAVVAKFRGRVSVDSLRDQMAWKRIFVAEIDGAIIATGSFANFGSTEEPKYSISNVFVCPEFQRRGVGGKVLGFLCELARGQGITSLYVPSVALI